MVSSYSTPAILNVSQCAHRPQHAAEKPDGGLV